MKPVIIGIDPGTTLGYAIIDFNGDIIKVDSMKNASLSDIISVFLGKYKPVIICSDVSKIPELLKKLKALTLAKIFLPRQNLREKEKALLIKSLKKERLFKNFHERDALASAIYCLKRISPKLRKIKSFLENVNKTELFEKFVVKAFLSNLSYESILKSLKKVEKVKELENREEKAYTTQPNIEKLERKLSILDRTNKILKKYIAKLKKENITLKKLLKSFGKEKEHKNYYKEKENYVRRISNLENKIMHLKKILVSGYEPVLCINSLTKEALKKIEEYQYNKDIIYVNNLNIFDKEIIRNLENIKVIIYNKKPDKKILPFLEFSLIKLQELKFKEFVDDILIVKKEEIEKILKEKNIVEKVIISYKNRLKSI